jgi:c-di-GMP-binding flagellar brake protein YcgR
MTDEKKVHELDTRSSYDFESLNLQVGSRLQVLLTSRSSTHAQYFSTLIGYVKDQYLIIKTPTDQGSPVQLREGEQATIRVFSGVNVGSFTAVIDRIFHHPCFYFHLSFPKVIQGTSLRKAIRIKVNIQGQLAGPGSASTSIPVTINNLSVAGALVESEQELTNSDGTFELTFAMITQPGNHEITLNTKGTIRNVNARKATIPDQQDTYTYGVEFVDLDPTHQIILQNLTYEALISDRQKIV